MTGDEKLPEDIFNFQDKLDQKLENKRESEDTNTQKSKKLRNNGGKKTIKKYNRNNSMRRR